MKVPKWAWMLAIAGVLITVGLFAGAMSFGGDSGVKVSTQTVPSTAVVPQEVSYPTNTGLAPDPAPVVVPPSRPANMTRIGSLLITVNSVRVVEDILPLDNRDQPQAHLRYVIVNITAQNIGDRGISPRLEGFKLVDNEFVSERAGFLSAADDRQISILLSGTGSRWNNDGLASGQEFREVSLTFKILKGNKPAFLDYASEYGDQGGRIPLG